ncbi:MAG: PAP/fibrillin family protein [Nostoc sp. LLA-1]|nr:PAP/fibrillin family protein [Cyanocohniella sp. LLY]
MTDSTLLDLKQELLATVTASEIGFNSTPDTKQKIETLAEKIESLNPTSEPTSHIKSVAGRWQLLYSTFALERETNLTRLSFGKLPSANISVTGIFQEIDLADQQYNNLIEFTNNAGVKGVVGVTGRYTIVDSKRLNIDFVSTYVKSLTNDLNDQAFREALELGLTSHLEAQLAGSGWSDITYLDEDLRLMRGNQQNLYVLLRQ